MQAVGAKTVGIDSVQLLSLQWLGGQKGPGSGKQENQIPGLKLSLLASALHLRVKGGRWSPALIMLLPDLQHLF